MATKSELKLTDLKVADLKAELDKRGLDKTGVKSVLIERLRNALEEEGIDPEEHEFENNISETNSVRNSKRKSEVGEEEEMDTSEGNQKDTSEKAIKLELDDEDTPCSDEEMDDYSKHKEDTESARFKTSTQSRIDSQSNENDVAAETEQNTDASKVDVKDDTETKTEISQHDSANSTSETTESAEAKGAKKSVLKVIGKDKVQQLALTAQTLWVTGLAITSKVSDLKNLFSKHGKVTSAKIVRSTKGTQRKWYGLLTMATSKDASKCIQKLHRTEFGGHVISVERRQTAPIVKKSDPSTLKKPIPKNDTKEAAVAKTDDAKKSNTAVDSEKRATDDEKAKSDDDRASVERGYRGYEGRSYYRGRGRAPFRRPFGGFRGRGSSFRGRGRFSGFRRPFGRPSPFDRPSFRPFSRGGFRYDFPRRSEERMSPRDYMRERDDRMREREEEMFRHKIIVRKQKEEAYRLEREKNQLRMEREMLEREKAEMLKLERAKQRMEREQLELEREKLRRQSQMSHQVKRPFRGRGGGGPPHVWAEKRRESTSPYDGPPSSFRDKFANEDKFSYREHSAYKKPDFPHEDFRREKMDIPPPHPKFAEREERREVTYHGGPERRVYSRNEFRGPHPGPSSSPRESFPPRSKPIREEWKFHERRSEKPGYPPRGRKMGYY